MKTPKTEWMMLYCLMDNIKNFMDNVMKENNGNIEQSDVQMLLKYIDDSINNVKKIFDRSIR